MYFKKGIALLLLFAISMSSFLPVTAANSESFEIIAPQQVSAGMQFSFTIKTNNLSQYTGISFSTNSERSQLPDNLLLAKGSESVFLKARFLNAGKYFLKAYSLKNPSHFAIALITVLPGDPQSGSIFPHYAGVMNGEFIKFETHIFDKYGNIVENLLSSFSIESLSGNASGKFNGSSFYATGSGECKIFLILDNIIVDEAYVFVYDKLSKAIKPDFTIEEPVTFLSSDYRINFVNAQEKILKGTKINIGFPKEFIMPCYCTRPITKNDIRINSRPLLSDPPKSEDTLFSYITLETPDDILQGESTTISISKDTLIQNPHEEGAYNVQLSIPQYEEPFFSNFVRVHNPITTPVFSASPSTGGETAEWIVHFTLTGYSFNKGSKIGIVFPFGSLLPDYPDPYLITINGFHLLSGTKIEKYNFRTYIIELQFDRSDGSDLWIDFSKKIGIRLPLGERVLRGSVFVNFEMKQIDSQPFFVDYVPFLLVERETEPPSSLNNYFNKSVILRFKSYSSIIDNEVNILYTLNGSEWDSFSGEILLSKDGTYTLNYKAVGKWGLASEEKIFVFNIDKTPPLIGLDHIEPIGSDKLKYVFKSSEPLSFVTINGFYTVCGFDESFYVIFEKGRFDSLKIDAKDLAGNEMVMEAFVKDLRP